jgi:3-methyladenine DNA glycosylase AlkD
MSSSKNSVTSWYSKALSDLKKLPGKGTLGEKVWVQRYLGSNKPTRCIKTGDIVKLGTELAKDVPPAELINLVNNLYSQATTFEEMHLAGVLLNQNPKLKTEVGLKKLNTWLNFTHGWAETDILCQNNWDTDIILANWPKWTKLLTKFAHHKNIHKRRASLVLLVTPVRKSSDQRLADIAFTNIELLKHEKEVLITKAVSWILRALIINHRQKVSDYLAKNKDTLPKIAIREVTNKLTTGKK